MRIETRVFGTVEIDESQIVTLTKPMPGFPQIARFAVLEPDPECPIKWFQSVDRDDVCFLIADPRHFFPGYRIGIDLSTVSDLGIAREDEGAVAVVVNVTRDSTRATANLLAPLVFNTARKLARQLILEGSAYPIRAPLMQEEKQVCQVG